MARPSPRLWLSVLWIGMTACLGTTETRAQDRGGLPSLGGYGANWNSSFGGMGAAGPIIPYTGHFAGFMPFRMGAAGSTLAFTPTNARALGSERVLFRLPSMESGLSSMSGGMGQGSGGRMRWPRSPAVPGLTDWRDQMGLPASTRGGSRVAPPDFGYPFYQPGGLLGTSSLATGMPSM